jgi:hypothetical protein
MKPIEVRVMTVARLLETVLAKVVRPLEIVGATKLGLIVDDEVVRLVVEVLVKVVVDPPDIVLVSVTRTVEMVGESALPLGTGKTLPIVVGVTLISVVVWPPETMLVIVIVIPDTPNEDEIGGVLVGNVGNDNVGTEGLDKNGNVDEAVVEYGGVNVGDGVPFDGIKDTEEMIGVISAVLVISVLNRLGGATLSSHPVVPLTTEK